MNDSIETDCFVKKTTTGDINHYEVLAPSNAIGISFTWSLPFWFRIKILFGYNPKIVLSPACGANITLDLE